MQYYTFDRYSNANNTSIHHLPHQTLLKFLKFPSNVHQIFVCRFGCRPFVVIPLHSFLFAEEYPFQRRDFTLWTSKELLKAITKLDVKRSIAQKQILDIGEN